MFMKVFLPLLMCLFVYSCASKQDMVSLEATTKQVQKCPENGSCSLTIMSDRSLITKKGLSGTFYPEFIESGHLVLKYEYKREKIPNTEDSHYSEVIYLELDPENLDSTLRDAELKTVKALFGRICFCRGQTGHYKIREGVLSIKKIEAMTYSLQFHFTIHEVPQIIKSFESVLILK